MITLLSSGARFASGTAAITSIHPDRIASANLQLDVTAVTTSIAGTLDVFVQHSIDGTNYDDFCHFTQCGATFAVPFRVIGSWVRNVASTSNLHQAATTTLAASVLQGPLGPTWRVAWGISSTSTFTFKVGCEQILIR